MDLSYPDRPALRASVGMVVPAWYPADLPAEEAALLLRTTLADAPACVDPDALVVVVDGSRVASAAAHQALAELRGLWRVPFRLVELAENQGKGAALAAGMRLLLRDRADLEWIAVRDADGDHLMDDLPHLVRAGFQLAEEAPGRLHCVIGRRASVHAPLGWLRGEYEWLLNEVVVEAVAFALAPREQVWDTRFLVGRVPDLQSGYKLYGRDAALRAVDALTTEADAHPELELQRTGMEIVPFVTLALAGGVFAEVERKTYHDQPVTSYGRVDRARFYGAKLAWALRACGVPPAPAALLLDGALAHRPLMTDPAARTEALALRELVLRTLADGEWPKGVPLAPSARRFL